MLGIFGAVECLDFKRFLKIYINNRNIFKTGSREHAHANVIIIKKL